MGFVVLTTLINYLFGNTSKVYPTLAAGVTVTASGTANTLGANATLCAANVITSPFRIRSVTVESVSASDVFELVLYKGESGSEIEIGRTRFSSGGKIVVGIVLQDANTRISAKLASVAGGGKTANISFEYCI